MQTTYSVTSVTGVRPVPVTAETTGITAFGGRVTGVTGLLEGKRIYEREGIPYGYMFSKINNCDYLRSPGHTNLVTIDITELQRFGDRSHLPVTVGTGGHLWN